MAHSLPRLMVNLRGPLGRSRMVQSCVRSLRAGDAESEACFFLALLPDGVPVPPCRPTSTSRPYSCQAILIAPGYPASLATDVTSGVELQHYQLVVDRGLSFENAVKLVRQKEKENGGRLLPGEGFYRRKCAI